MATFLGKVEKEKPDYLFIFSRFINIGDPIPSNITKIENDPIYKTMKAQAEKLSKLVKNKIFLMQQLPRLIIKKLPGMVEAVKGKKDLAEFDKSLIDIDPKMARLRYEKLASECPKCELLDYEPYFFNKTTKTWRFYDEKMNGLTYMTQGLHLSFHGLELIRPVIKDNTNSCSPRDSTTFVFAYSNDFDPSVVQDVFSYFSKGVSPHYTTFAIVRFDVKNDEDFVYTSNWSDIVSYVQTHLPDPSLSFKNNSTGSDVLTKIEQFLDNIQVPVCGSNMLLLVKRWLNLVDATPIAKKLREQHSYFTMLASTSSSGGLQSITLYELACQTNGVCGFDKDEDMKIAVQIVPSFFNPYLIYAVNPKVYKNGTIQLPSLIVPNEVPSGYWFTMTVQVGPLSAVKVAYVSWLNKTAVNPGFELGIWQNGNVGFWYGNHLGSANDLSAVTYDMTLRYAYLDTQVRYLQIRVYGQITSPVDYWPLYDFGL